MFLETVTFIMKKKSPYFKQIGKPPRFWHGQLMVRNQASHVSGYLCVNTEQIPHRNVAQCLGEVFENVIQSKCVPGILHPTRERQRVARWAAGVALTPEARLFKMA